jgi:flagellar biosynthetic protein FliR
MNSETLFYFTFLYEHIDIYLLILVRVLAFFMFLPVVSGMGIPMQARLMLAVVFSAVLFSSGVVTEVTYSNSPVGYFVLILTEFMAGMLMGYALYFIFNIIFYAGQLIDYQIGLSMMSVLDPQTQIQVPIAGNLYYMTVMGLLVVNGGIESFVGAFWDSYKIVPMGVANVAGNQGLAWFLLTLLTEFMVVGVQIALPVVGTILLIDAALGILVKAVPQMNVFVIGMPLKLIGGLAILFFLARPMVSMVYSELFERAYNALTDVIWGMAPS